MASSLHYESLKPFINLVTINKISYNLKEIPEMNNFSCPGCGNDNCYGFGISPIMTVNVSYSEGMAVDCGAGYSWTDIYKCSKCECIFQVRDSQ